jgi:hypothetical protein
MRSIIPTTLQENFSKNLLAKAEIKLLEDAFSADFYVSEDL